jgi:Histidine kinase-, DNA gyrase B-, and HSP90-like ATPase
MTNTSNDETAAVDATPSTETELLQRVASARDTGAPIFARLKTDERVFARITDGIYREPASALRELIANSYDADATEVRIETDAPRFSKIVIRDNGRGLSEDALVHVICHIGGSLKRTNEGKKYNVVNPTDANLSPGGRRLIGKLGIGLFSVSQLTHHLIIVTKVKGEYHRRVCDILLMPQREETQDQQLEDEGFITGKAQLSTVPAEDIDSQGTEITLLEIRPFVRESLQSAVRWAAIEEENRINSLSEQPDDEYTDADEAEDDGFRVHPKVPDYHIGEVSRIDGELLLSEPKLPWSKNDPSTKKFEKLVAAVHSLSNPKITGEKVKLRDVLDTYLGMLWTLGLSIPIPYIKKHPFDLSADNNISAYALSNKVSGRAEPLALAQGQTVREKLGLTTGANRNSADFAVIVDEVQLFRPLTYPGDKLNVDEASHPVIFFGKLKTELQSLPKEYRGGPLEFEAYLYWQPKVVPAEHNGIMIRINGASGILFDKNFLDYQVSELQRLRQITAEIFIGKGLDAALNIDRESFNIAHPHFQYITKWVHHALKQLMSRHKSLQQGKSYSNLENKKSEALDELQRIVQKKPDNESKIDVIRDIIFLNKSKSTQIELPSELTVTFEKNSLFAARANVRPLTKSERLRESLFEEKVRAVATLLDRYGLLERLPAKDQAALLTSIVEIFSVEIKK